MKKKPTVIVIGVLLMGMVFSGATLAAGKWGATNPGYRHHRQRGDDGLMRLTRYMQQNLAVAVLADMSGQPSETVRQKLHDQRMRSLLEELNIDPKAFWTAMQAKVNDLVQNLTAGGFITPEQAKEFEAKMERRAERRALMNQLIEKGIADGTITREQAQTLMRKHH